MINYRLKFSKNRITFVSTFMILFFYFFVSLYSCSDDEKKSSPCDETIQAEFEEVF